MLISMAWKEMLQDKKYEGLTNNSLQSYYGVWLTLGKWLEENKIEHVDQLTPRVFKLYLRHCTEVRNNKPKSINTKLKLIRAFCHWLQDEGLTEGYMAENLKMVISDSETRIVKETDIRLALRHLRRIKRREDDFYAVRNHAIIVFLIGTGLRANELCQLNRSDIDSSGLIILRKTKARKFSSVPLSERVARELQEWQEYERQIFAEKHLPEPLFCTREGRRLTRNGLRLMFNRVRERAGIEGTFCCHGMRNAFIKGLLKGGANLREAQLLARHSRIDMTEKYIGYFQNELQDAIDEHDPLKGLI
ncbi:tyrosine-type recombinase/integrase [Sporolactobacillus nakayamae]|uniref:Site-specific recombinase XerD n=1 Tax=Sporolactobacillus nakayamae TaxID=269670 RepID=A0A1I2TVK4_9BACL|nr:tyrosine-type recombinase/integrase [Sporolactobacillus nakayamae]SFG68922.1 Site-specific recombinase XerD [Sporolactobacillus nakayamae]